MNDPTEERVVGALHAYADHSNAPEAWESIVERLEGRSRRSPAWWIVPSAVALAVVVLIALLARGGVVGGGPDGTSEQVVAQSPEISSSIFAVTADERIIEMDAEGNERREISDLSRVDAGLGNTLSDEFEAENLALAAQLETSADGQTIYLPRAGDPSCPGEPIPSIAAIDVTTGEATELIKNAAFAAVSPEGQLAYIQLGKTLESGSPCVFRFRIVVGGGQSVYDWPTDLPPPTGLTWLGNDRLVVSAQGADVTSAHLFELDSDLQPTASLDAEPGTLVRGTRSGEGLVFAGSADWDGVTFENEVWYQPSVDPPPGFEGDLSDFTRSLFFMGRPMVSVDADGAPGNVLLLTDDNPDRGDIGQRLTTLWLWSEEGDPVPLRDGILGASWG